MRESGTAVIVLEPLDGVTLLLLVQINFYRKMAACVYLQASNVIVSLRDSFLLPAPGPMSGHCRAERSYLRFGRTVEGSFLIYLTKSHLWYALSHNSSLIHPTS